jgi:hypothetical protein
MNTGRAVIAAGAAAGRRQDYSQHLRMPEGCIRYGRVEGEAGHFGHSKTATDGHNRRMKAAEQGHQE